MKLVGRFTPEYSDSINLDSLEIVSAWMEVEPGPYGYSRAKTYKNIIVHYSDAFTACEIRVWKNGELVKTDSLIADGKYHKFNYALPDSPGKIKIEYSSKISPNIL